jgi:eukaryotic-like serine/threonine-protein kinase
VGLLLYSLLVGHGPFAHVEHVLDVLDAHIRQVPEPPSRHAAQAIPPELDRAVLKALAKRPEHRFQSAELFAEELGRIAASLAGATGPLPAAPGRATSTERLPPSVEVTAQGTVVLRPAPAPSPAGGGGVAWDPEVEAWFASLPGLSRATPAAGLPARFAAAARRVPGGAVLFVLLTLASTGVFSLIAALLLRWLGG